MAQTRKKKKTDRLVEPDITKYFRSVSRTRTLSAGVSGDCRQDDLSGESDSEVKQEPGSSRRPASLDGNVNDIGVIIKELMTDSGVSTDVLGLTAGQKYTLLSQHYKPGPNFVFPKVVDSGCYRSFQGKWLDKYPWFVYSKEVDGGSASVVACL